MVFEKVAKPTSAFGKVAEAISSFKKLPLWGYLLQETSAYLLLETGDKIIIGGLHPTTWGKTGETTASWGKTSKPTSSFGGVAKP